MIEKHVNEEGGCDEGGSVEFNKYLLLQLYVCHDVSVELGIAFCVHLCTVREA